MWYWLFKYIFMGPLLSLLGRPKVEGLEHIPADGPAILASNHLAVADSFYLPLVAPRRITFLAKQEYFTGTGLKGRAIEAQYVPTAAPQTFDLRLYADFAAVPRQIGRAVDAGQRTGVRAEKDAEGYTRELNDPHGFYRQVWAGLREGSIDAGRAFAFELVGVSGPEQTRIGEALLEGAVR